MPPSPELPFPRAEPVQARIYSDAGDPPGGVLKVPGVLPFERLEGLEENILSGRVRLVGVLKQTLAESENTPLLGSHPCTEIGYQHGAGAHGYQRLRELT